MARSGSRDEAMLTAVDEGRVTYHRLYAGPTAPDFYRHEWRVDGVLANSFQRRVLEDLHRDYAITTDGFLGVMGPATSPVRRA